MKNELHRREQVRNIVALLLSCAGPWAASALLAQTAADLAPARAIYEREIARCNSADLPAPQREACIRQAGAQLDRARLGPGEPGDLRTTNDGRATLVPGTQPLSPANSAATTTADTVVSPDGRSTIVVPTDGAVRGQTQ